MKKMLAVMIMIAVIAGSAAAQKSKKPTKPAKPVKPETTLSTIQQKISYGVGYDIGSKIMGDIKKQEIDINAEAFIQGMRDVFLDKKPALPDSELQSVMMIFQQQMMAKQNANAKKYQEMIEKEKKAGEEFLAENGKKDSVKTTASGLQYKILKEGTGKSPEDTSTVTVQYRGKLLNGMVFDESYARGEPVTFKLNQMIKGWIEGLKFLKEGGKIELYIPSELAYGDQGRGQLIPPGAALIFEVELLEVK
jgi:FKBP-type peptidyl-prolyl cis-trans isomerase